MPSASQSQTDPSASLGIRLDPGPGQEGWAALGWQRLADLPLTILVGLTGVGKSTILAALAAQGYPFRLLPNRRALTDWLIIPTVQALAGEPIQPVTDRTARFDYTRRYRERFPGGMAHALGQLSLDPAAWVGPLIFDGLRGVDEVTHAAARLPQARFVLLHAPDSVRVQRLLGRKDLFDHVGSGSLSHAGHGSAIRSFADLGLPAGGELFNQEQAQALLALVHRGEVSPAELAAKLQIVIEERRHYDPDAALAALGSLAPARTLAVDTTIHSPTQAAGMIAEFMDSPLAARHAHD